MGRLIKHLRLCLAGLACILSFAPVLVPAVAHAQTTDPFQQVCAGNGSNSTVCQEKSKIGNPLFGKTGIVTKITQLVALFVGIASVFMIVVGGIRYVFSRGDSGAVNQARNTIVYALAGLVIALAAQAIVAFVLEKL
jgi:hypothetical protein